MYKLHIMSYITYTYLGHKEIALISLYPFSQTLDTIHTILNTWHCKPALLNVLYQHYKGFFKSSKQICDSWIMHVGYKYIGNTIYLQLIAFKNLYADLSVHMHSREPRWLWSIYLLSLHSQLLLPSVRDVNPIVNHDSHSCS